MSRHKTTLSSYAPWALFLIILISTLVGCTTNPDVSVIPSSGDVSVHFIDTGNSDSILIKDGTTSVLIDGGDNEDGNTVVNYLTDQGITKLTYMIATHPHADHIGGLDTILKNIDVDTLYVANGDADTKTYRDFINAAMDKGLTPSVPLEDKQFKLTNSYFEVFNTNGGKDANEESLVVLLTNGDDKFLFTGDAEKETEKEILDKMSSVDVLKVGHHGSSSSTTPEFFNKLSPQYAVLTVGKDNKYGHPHRETMTLLKKHSTEVHRNDECGTVVFTSSGNGVHTNCPIGSYTAGSDKKADTSTPSSNSSNAIVYWTPNGKSYHKTNQCSGLSKSKTILSGTLTDSGKSDPCDRCYSK